MTGVNDLVIVATTEMTEVETGLVHRETEEAKLVEAMLAGATLRNSPMRLP